jgi:hypothetical protein
MMSVYSSSLYFTLRPLTYICFQMLETLIIKLIQRHLLSKLCLDLRHQLSCNLLSPFNIVQRVFDVRFDLG